MHTPRFPFFASQVVRGLSIVLLAGLVTVGTGCGLFGSSGSGGSSGSTAPAAPSGLTGTSGDGQVVLDWQTVSGAEGYNVYRSTASGSEMEGDPLAGGVSSTTYTDDGATNGTRYYYVVTAMGEEDTESGPSNAVSRTPFASPPGDRPDQP